MPYGINFPGSLDAQMEAKSKPEQLDEGDYLRSRKFSHIHREIDAAAKPWHDAYKARLANPSHENLHVEREAADHYHKTFGKHSVAAHMSNNHALGNELHMHHGSAMHGKALAHGVMGGAGWMAGIVGGGVLAATGIPGVAHVGALGMAAGAAAGAAGLGSYAVHRTIAAKRNNAWKDKSSFYRAGTEYEDHRDKIHREANEHFEDAYDDNVHKHPEKSGGWSPIDAGDAAFEKHMRAHGYDDIAQRPINGFSSDRRHPDAKLEHDAFQ